MIRAAETQLSCPKRNEFTKCQVTQTSDDVILSIQFGRDFFQDPDKPPDVLTLETLCGGNYGSLLVTALFDGQCKPDGLPDIVDFVQYLISAYKLQDKSCDKDVGKYCYFTIAGRPDPVESIFDMNSCISVTELMKLSVDAPLDSAGAGDQEEEITFSNFYSHKYRVSTSTRGGETMSQVTYRVTCREDDCNQANGECHPMKATLHMVPQEGAATNEGEMLGVDLFNGLQNKICLDSDTKSIIFILRVTNVMPSLCHRTNTIREFNRVFKNDITVCGMKYNSCLFVWKNWDTPESKDALTKVLSIDDVEKYNKHRTDLEKCNKEQYVNGINDPPLNKLNLGFFFYVFPKSPSETSQIGNIRISRIGEDGSVTEKCNYSVAEKANKEIAKRAAFSAGQYDCLKLFPVDEDVYHIQVGVEIPDPVNRTFVYETTFYRYNKRPVNSYFSKIDEPAATPSARWGNLSGRADAIARPYYFVGSLEGHSNYLATSNDVFEVRLSSTFENTHKIIARLLPTNLSDVKDDARIILTSDETTLCENWSKALEECKLHKMENEWSVGYPLKEEHLYTEDNQGLYQYEIPASVPGGIYTLVILPLNSVFSTYCENRSESIRNLYLFYEKQDPLVKREPVVKSIDNELFMTKGKPIDNIRMFGGESFTESNSDLSYSWAGVPSPAGMDRENTLCALEMGGMLDGLWPSGLMSIDISVSNLANYNIKVSSKFSVTNRIDKLNLLVVCGTPPTKSTPVHMFYDVTAKFTSFAGRSVSKICLEKSKLGFLFSENFTVPVSFEMSKSGIHYVNKDIDFVVGLRSVSESYSVSQFRHILFVKGMMVLDEVKGNSSHVVESKFTLAPTNVDAGWMGLDNYMISTYIIEGKTAGGVLTTNNDSDEDETQEIANTQYVVRRGFMVKFLDVSCYEEGDDKTKYKYAFGDGKCKKCPPLEEPKEGLVDCTSILDTTTRVMITIFSLLGALLIVVAVIVGVICVKKRNIRKLADKNRLPPVVEPIEDVDPLDNMSFHIIDYESSPTPEEEESTEEEVYIDPLDGLSTVFRIEGHGMDTPLGDYPEM